MPNPYVTVESNEMRKTASNINVQNSASDIPLRESQSFTHGSSSFCTEEDHQNGVKCSRSNGYIYTRRKDTGEAIWIPDTILSYQGKRYPESAIATVWKKDCRTWLWKKSSKVTKKDKIREQALVRMFKTLNLKSEGKRMRLRKRHFNP